MMEMIRPNGQANLGDSGGYVSPKNSEIVPYQRCDSMRLGVMIKVLPTENELVMIINLDVASSSVLFYFWT